MAVSQSKMEVIARCAVAGLGNKDISAYCGISKETVGKYLAGGHSESFDRIYQALQERSTRALVDHRFRMMDFLEQAYTVTKQTLENEKDPRLRYEAAKDVFRIVTGLQDQPNGVNVNLGIQNNTYGEHIQLAVGQTQSLLGDIVSALRSRREAGGPDPHEKVGDEALPVSYQLVKDQLPSTVEGGGNGADHSHELFDREVPEGTPVEPED